METLVTTTALVLRGTAESDLDASATDVGALPQMQAGLLEWTKRRVEIERASVDEANASLQAVIDGGFAVEPFTRLIARAQRRLEYFEKIAAALEAGYIVFPPVDAQAFAIRIRETRDKPRKGATFASWESHRQKADLLPLGSGRYVSPLPIVYSEKKERVETAHATGETKIVLKDQYFADEWKDAEFPLIMARPEIIDATTRAMALQTFDDLALIPARPAGDPVIVGRVWSPDRKRQVSFLIAWNVSTREFI